ncbi:hypothetical protein EYZ11_008839 [Aspergillus tanneri]|uniref:Zn(2)-C6 fungal-type domain-containing protein n=1 Tax=Aspergillus tanneri TaxID=1220188 RepID=A0A4V3UNL6_9EURO|nr:hypothetical protein EYZ11_008839 [Aspergillus tanneri]
MWRQVIRCDRNDPCGNCLDQKSACTRTRGMKRLPKRNLAQIPRGTYDHQPDGPLASQSWAAYPQSLQDGVNQAGDSSTFDVGSHRMGENFSADMLDNGPSMILNRFDINYELHNWIAFVPLTDAQMINRHQLELPQGLAWSRHQALESALFFASQIPGILDQCAETVGEISGEERCSIPSIEFLHWMLNDIGSDKFGSFALGFFRHIGKDTLKYMGSETPVPRTTLQRNGKESDEEGFTHDKAFAFFTTSHIMWGE